MNPQIGLVKDKLYKVEPQFTRELSKYFRSPEFAEFCEDHMNDPLDELYDAVYEDFAYWLGDEDDRKAANRGCRDWDNAA